MQSLKKSEEKKQKESQQGESQTENHESLALQP